MKKYRVGVLGATGAVGQQFIRLLENHPWFDVTAVAASERSAGKTYAEATRWVLGTPIPEAVAGMTLQAAEPNLDCDLVFSGMDASVAGEIEAAFARAGYPVISNTRNYRMQENVPLLIPEVNPEHTALVDHQEWGPGGAFIVTNPNCSTVGLVCALKPIYDTYGIEAVQVTTMQAISGAGYPGVPSLDILSNVVPYIGGEEDKMRIEPLKLLGTVNGGKVDYADFPVSAQCNRVPVLDGHLLCISVKLGRPAEASDVEATLRHAPDPLANLDLPTSPERWLKYHDDAASPQPRRHADLGNGMTVSVGRVRKCEVLDVKLVALVHNTVRGAAGGAILNAELLIKQGRIRHRA